MDEGFRARLLEAMRAEDSKLKSYIDKCQLDAWYRTTKDAAEKMVADAYRDATMARAGELPVNGNGNGSVFAFDADS